MKSLIFVVETDAEIKKILTGFLNASGIDFIFTTDLKDALTLFKQNKKIISHIAIDTKPGVDINKEQPEIVELAEIIANSNDFNGEVFVMSSDQTHNDDLTFIIGHKCESPVDSGCNIKKDTIKEIIRRIEKQIILSK